MSSAKRPATSSGGPQARRQKVDEPEKSRFEETLANLSTRHGQVRDVRKEATWKRKELTYGKDSSSSIAVQIVDLDYISENSGVTVRLFGSTNDGYSACVNVTGYRPYFYALVPDNFRPEQKDAFQHKLNEVAKSFARSSYGLTVDIEYVVTGLEIVSGMSLYGYTTTVKNFFKIYVVSPRIITGFSKSLARGISISGEMGTPLACFEANIDFEVRFMVDTNLVGGGWVELPEKKYKIYNDRVKATLCQIEATIKVEDLIVHAPEGEWGKVAPLRTLSFDIECAGRPGVFPEASQDSVIQIANMVKLEGTTEPFIRNCFVVGTCANVVGSDIIECKDEKELLIKWAEFVRTVDPDILTGYNIQNFDLPYIIDRSKQLKIDASVHLLGRVKNSGCRIRDQQSGSKQMGNRVNKMIVIEGRIIFDVLQVVLRDYKLRSYTLNSVSYHFLCEQKEDVEHQIITTLFHGSDYDRRRLAVYCMKDAYLPLRLLDKLMSVINYMEMARVTGVPLNFLIFRGQQVKVLSQLMRKTKTQNLFLPVIEVNQDNETYEGATVIEPIRGFHNTPIATLDFASLYPSIMIAHNLCYTTLLRYPPANLKLDEDYIKTPSGNYFVKPHKRKGLLADILEDLLSARKRAKNELKDEKDPFRQMVLNGRQMALKISANSVYGFTGATVGKLPCLEISQSVTSFGREMIDLTKSSVETLFREGAFDGLVKKDAVVIYGDTDSVMVKFGVDTVAEAMKLGQLAANEVSKQFPKPIKLEFEKVYFPYLLINKKRYAGLYFTNPDKHDKMDCKGLETVRRDNAPLVGVVLNKCLEKLMLERNANSALEYAKKVIADLLCNRIDISMLIISKELTKKGEKYQAKQAHVELAERMRKRDPGSAPRMGDRVPYVIVAKGKNVPAYEKAEDPIYVLRNGIPIDTKYYLENQLAKPLARIFESILGDKAESMLINGDHTRVKIQPTAKVGGLVAHMKKIPTCIGCKAVMKDENPKALCDYCMQKRCQIYTEKAARLKTTQRHFSRLWTECQNCAGTLQEEILCSSRDCPIFYMREKVRMDLRDQTEIIDRFNSL